MVQDSCSCLFEWGLVSSALLCFFFSLDFLSKWRTETRRTGSGSLIRTSVSGSSARVSFCCLWLGAPVEVSIIPVPRYPLGHFGILSLLLFAGFEDLVFWICCHCIPYFSRMCSLVVSATGRYTFLPDCPVYCELHRPGRLWGWWSYRYPYTLAGGQLGWLRPLRLGKAPAMWVTPVNSPFLGYIYYGKERWTILWRS